MGKTIQVPIEFIEEAYEAACTSWKEKIMNTLPEYKDYVKSSKYYKCGDLFICNRTKYILANMDGKKINLFSLKDGNRWSDTGMVVRDTDKVSALEFEKFVKGYVFKEIKK